MKKVLLITPYHYPEGGGLEWYALSVAKQLKDYSFSYAYLSKKTDFVISNTPIRIKFLWEILSIIKKENIDLIHAHTPVPFAVDMAAIASRLKKVPLVITYHSSKLTKGIWWLDPIVKIYELWERLTLKQAKKIIAVSPHIKSSKKFKKYNNKTDVITPGVDLEEFEGLEDKFPQHDIIFCISPLLKPYRSIKGLDVLLDAMVKVKKQIPNIKLKVAGEKGDDYNFFQQKTEKLNLEKNVDFLGKINKQEMRQQYHNSILTVVPSLSTTEGCPTVLFEAGASKRPVVGSDISGIPHIIKNKFNGIIIEPGNVQQLAEAILLLLLDKNKARILGINAHEEARIKYTWQKIAEKYKNIYEEILE